MAKTPVCVQRIKDARTQLSSLDVLNPDAGDVIDNVIWDIQASARSIRRWRPSAKGVARWLDDSVEPLLYGLDLRNRNAPGVLDDVVSVLDDCLRELEK